jgi:DNA-binding transcriptional LysR family regulator
MTALNWDDLRFFLTLARENRLSAAGRVLGVKHTTVARRITALEARLGARLFDHSADGYNMNQAGENLYQHALVMEERALAVNREIVGMDAQLAGPLKLTAPANLMSLMIVPAMRRLQEAYPGIEVELIGTTGLLDLAARQADIALRFTPAPPDYLIGRKVLSMQHGVYASEEYLRHPRDRHQVILWDGDTVSPPWMEQHFPDARLALRVDEISVMVTALNHHYGLARIPCLVGDSEPSLRRIDVTLEPSTWGLWVLSHVDLRATARVRVCREFLIEMLLEQRDLIEGRNSRYSGITPWNQLNSNP